MRNLVQLLDNLMKKTACWKNTQRCIVNSDQIHYLYPISELLFLIQRLIKSLKNTNHGLENRLFYFVNIVKRVLSEDSSTFQELQINSMAVLTNIVKNPMFNMQVLKDVPIFDFYKSMIKMVKILYFKQSRLNQRLRPGQALRINEESLNDLYLSEISAFSESKYLKIPIEIFIMLNKMS